MNKVLVFAACGLLAACNESSSGNVANPRMVLRGDLQVSGSSVKLKASLGKEGSSVVVVLEGGDALYGSDGVSRQRMEYVADLFGSYYRTAFPLDAAAHYAVMLTRAADGSQTTSLFPSLPTAYAITAPLNGSSLSLAANPWLAVTWDALVTADEFAHDAGVACDWRIVPGPGGAASALVHLSSGRYELLSYSERTARRKDVPLRAYVDDQRADLGIDYPYAAATLLGCDATFSLYAKNRGNAAGGLSPYSEMTARRSADTAIRVTP